MKEWATWGGAGRRARALEPLGFARGITDHHATLGSRSPLAGKGESEPVRGADQTRVQWDRQLPIAAVPAPSSHQAPRGFPKEPTEVMSVSDLLIYCCSHVPSNDVIMKNRST